MKSADEGLHRLYQRVQIGGNHEDTASARTRTREREREREEEEEDPLTQFVLIQELHTSVMFPEVTFH